MYIGVTRHSVRPGILEYLGLEIMEPCVAVRRHGSMLDDGPNICGLKQGRLRTTGNDRVPHARLHVPIEIRGVVEDTASAAQTQIEIRKGR